jgi:hypothetical protein
MKSLLYGIAALPFLATFATAEPLQLSSNQMDKVTAGVAFTEVDVFNTGRTEVAAYAALPVAPATFCGGAAAGCYLAIRSPALSILSWMPPITLPTVGQ